METVDNLWTEPGQETAGGRRNVRSNVKLLSRIKERLEAPERGAATMTARLLDCLVLTYAVPAARVRPHLPDGLPPDLLPGPDGEPLAFLQTVCAYWDDLRWSPARPGSGDSYHRCDYRILTRKDGRRGAFSVCLFVSTSSAHLAQRALAHNADYGRFSVHISGDPVRGRFQSYSLRLAGDLGRTEIEVAAPEGEADPAAPAPFGSPEDMALFLTQREEWYYAAALPRRGIGLTPVEHEPLTPSPGRLVSAKLTPWATLDLLSPEEQQVPHSALLEPAVNVTLYPPRLAKLAK